MRRVQHIADRERHRLVACAPRARSRVRPKRARAAPAARLGFEAFAEPCMLGHQESQRRQQRQAERGNGADAQAPAATGRPATVYQRQPSGLRAGGLGTVFVPSFPRAVETVIQHKGDCPGDDRCGGGGGHWTGHQGPDCGGARPRFPEIPANPCLFPHGPFLPAGSDLPAGSLPALRAAVDNGADAVYLGYKNDTNARNFAGPNFDQKAMVEGVRYAHGKGCEVLMAINTFPQPGRVADWRAAVDGAVDPGRCDHPRRRRPVFDYARQRNPNQRLHLGTGSATSYEAINFAHREFGVRRAVLPRVLTLAQVEHVIRNTPVEIEVFGFGSLCVMNEGAAGFPPTLPASRRTPSAPARRPST